MKKHLCLLFLFIAVSKLLLAQNGSSCDEPLVIFPSVNCENTDGTQFFGKMQCPSGDCSSYFTMSGSSLAMNPACSEDDERKESVVWIKVRATADNFTINNGHPYIGSGAAQANTKDYTVYSGTCADMLQIACHTLTANTSVTVSGLVAGKDYFILASPAVTQTKADAISFCLTSTVSYEAPGNSCSDAVELRPNNTYTFNNAGATADGPQAWSSNENNTWYKWTTPSDWQKGQSAFIRIYNPVCNSSEGLQITLWNTNKDCPVATDKFLMVSQSPGEKMEYYHQWTPVENRTYYLSVDGFAGTACQFNLEFGVQQVAPVNLITLEAKSNGKNISLTWETSEEMNNSFFTIEKSKDGQKFVPLTKLDGAGKSTTVRTYSCQDEYPFSKINYYRLRQTDEQGNYTYSKIVAVNAKGNGSPFHASVTPGKEKIDIGYFSDENEKALIRIYNIDGKQMYNMNLPVSQGRNDYRINTLLFPRGKYLLKLETPSAILTEDILLEED